MNRSRWSKAISVALLSGALLLASTGGVAAENGDTETEADGEVPGAELQAQQPTEDDENGAEDGDETPPVPPGDEVAPPDEQPDVDQPEGAVDPETLLNEEERRADPFVFRITPELWVPWVRGDITTDGQEFEIDQHPGEAIGDFTMGWLLGLELGVDQVRLLADALWLPVGQGDVTTDEGFDEADAEFHNFVTNASVGWVSQLDGFGEIGPHAGIRYSYVDSSLETVDDEDEQDFEATEGWIDPIVGVTGRIDPRGIVYIPYYADIGGMLAGSDLSWQARVSFGIKLNEYTGVEVGYRHLHIDYEGDELDYGIMTSGPTLGVSGMF